MVDKHEQIEKAARGVLEWDLSGLPMEYSGLEEHLEALEVALALQPDQGAVERVREALRWLRDTIDSTPDRDYAISDLIVEDAMNALQPDAAARAREDDSITVPRSVWELMQAPCACGHDRKKCGGSGWSEAAQRGEGE